MDPATQHSVLQLLGDAMSDILEEAYCGGWLSDTESIVPELCRRAIATGATQFWGHTEVPPSKALGLMYLADQLGCWANLNVSAISYDPHQPFPISNEIAAYLDSEQLSRSGTP